MPSGTDSMIELVAYLCCIRLHTVIIKLGLTLLTLSQLI